MLINFFFFAGTKNPRVIFFSTNFFFRAQKRVTFGIRDHNSLVFATPTFGPTDWAFFSAKKLKTHLGTKSPGDKKSRSLVNVRIPIFDLAVEFYQPFSATRTRAMGNDDTVHRP